MMLQVVETVTSSRFGSFSIVMSLCFRASRRRWHKGVHTEENEVTQLVRDFDTTNDNMIIRETFRSIEKLLILVALGFDQRSKAKEGARVVVLPLTRSGWNKVDQPIVAGNLQGRWRCCSPRNSPGTCGGELSARHSGRNVRRTLKL
jgi:hypothetical protein